MSNIDVKTTRTGTDAVTAGYKINKSGLTEKTVRTGTTSQGVALNADDAWK